MAISAIFRTGTLIATILVIMGFAEKYYPDFDCHRTYDIPEARRSTNRFRGNWKICKDEGKRKEYGIREKCDKVCMLAQYGLITIGFSLTNPRPVVDHSIIGWDAAASLLANVSGMAEMLDMGSGSEAKSITKVMEMVSEGMKNCSITHGNTTTAKMTEPCDKWEPILDCLERAYGCQWGS